MRCHDCGHEVPLGVNPLRYINEHLGHCSAFQARIKREKEEKGDVSDQIRVVTWKDLEDGTYLVCNKGDDIDQSHWHVARDGTILSIKEGGCYLYNRRQIRKNIRDVTGINLPLRWS